MMNWDEMKMALLYPRVKQGVSLIARVALIAISLAVGLSLLGGLGILLITALDLSYSPELLKVLYTNYLFVHLATCIFCACVGLLLPWSHIVLLYKQGWDITRSLTWLAAVLGCFVLVAEPLVLLTGWRIFVRQAYAPFIIMMLLLMIAAVNWNNMAVLHWSRRGSFILIAALAIMTLLLGLFMEPALSTVLRIGILLLAIKPLRWLLQNACKVIALPPL